MCRELKEIEDWKIEENKGMIFLSLFLILESSNLRIFNFLVSSNL